MEKSYTTKELENVLQTEDINKIEDYFNQFSYIKNSRGASKELLNQYINNNVDLNVIVKYGNKYKGEHLHFLLGMCKIHS